MPLLPSQEKAKYRLEHRKLRHPVAFPYYSYSQSLPPPQSDMATTTTVMQDELPLTARIGELDRHGFLFGQKLAASMSPLLHSVVYRELGLRWEQIRLDSTDMGHFLKLMKHPKFYG